MQEEDNDKFAATFLIHYKCTYNGWGKSISANLSLSYSCKLQDRSRCQVNYSVYNKWLVFNRYFCYRTGLFRRFFNAEYGNCYTFNSGVGKPLSGLLKSYKSGMRFGKAYNFYIVSAIRWLEPYHHIGMLKCQVTYSTIFIINF